MTEPIVECRHPAGTFDRLVNENIQLRRELAACRALLQTILDATAMLLTAAKDKDGS